VIKSFPVKLKVDTSANTLLQELFMNSTGAVERCLSFINCHLQSPKSRLKTQQDTERFRAVTISRQAGSGGHSVAERLAELLPAKQPGEVNQWMIFDRNLVEKVLEEHHLPARLSRFMPEDHISSISDTMDELFGLHPPSSDLVRKTSETILHLAELGHVIVIGRAANIITQWLPHVFHVRLVGSLKKRMERLAKSNGLSQIAARKLADQEDLARHRYVRQFFNKNIEDPLLYHLTINTDLLSIDDAARMIAREMMPNSVALAA
jgi:cytidylate kinase